MHPKQITFNISVCSSKYRDLCGFFHLICRNKHCSLSSIIFIEEHLFRFCQQSSVLLYVSRWIAVIQDPCHFSCGHHSNVCLHATCLFNLSCKLHQTCILAVTGGLCWKWLLWDTPVETIVHQKQCYYSTSNVQPKMCFPEDKRKLQVTCIRNMQSHLLYRMCSDIVFTSSR